MKAELKTTYLGLELANPLVASAGPLTGSVDSIRRLEENGIAAIVFPSLFEEQIEHEEMEIQRLYEYQTDAFAEALTHFPDVHEYATGPQAYLRRIEEAKRRCEIPVIASLNGSSNGGWIRYAKMMENAGADALELNIYFIPTDVNATSLHIEQGYVELVHAVKQSVGIPLSVKIGSQFSSIPNIAMQLTDAGADGLVLFNRYLEPDIDLETLQAYPDLILSQRHEVRLPLRWLAILRDQLMCSLAASGGIHFTEGVIKVLLAGADVAMMTTTLLRHGPTYVAQLVEELRQWMIDHHYESVQQMKGSMSRGNCPDPSAFERGNYMKALIEFTTEHPIPEHFR